MEPWCRWSRGRIPLDVGELGAQQPRFGAACSKGRAALVIRLCAAPGCMGASEVDVGVQGGAVIMD